MKIRSRYWEIFLLWVAMIILGNRNVSRSSYISRQDNNETWYMYEKLRGIINRMKSGYKELTNEDDK